MANIVTKKHLSNLERSRKIIAFQELLKGNQSQRSASRLLDVPKSTLINWQGKDNEHEEIDRFLSTSEGIAFLNRIILAAQMVIQYKGRGIRCMSEFISISGLSRYVANSRGAIHTFSQSFEKELINIGEEERTRLSEKMSKKKSS